MIFSSGDYEVIPAPDSELIQAEMKEEEEFAGKNMALVHRQGTNHFIPSPDCANTPNPSQGSNSDWEIEPI